MPKTAFKTSSAISNYVLQRKKRNQFISCRRLADETSEKFKLNISKSTINLILKRARISSPVGRATQRIFRPDIESSGAGFAFIFGACIMLGVAKILSSVVKKTYPLVQMKADTLEAVTEAWIMAKAIYNVPLDRIEEYQKNELWNITGRKVSKGILKRYIEALKVSQLFKNQLVSELTHCLQDVHYLRFTLADNTHFILDGQLRSVWQESKIPYDFSVTIDTANSYINKIFFGSDPIVVFSARPESVLGEEISNFIFSIDGSSSAKRIRRIEYVSPNSNVIKEIPFVVPDKRRFVIGIWPWQYKYIAELEKKTAGGKVVLEQFSAGTYYVSDTIKFVQHAQNIDVMLRLIALKSTKDGPATIAILSNLDANEWDTKRIVEYYLRHWPDPEAGHKFFLTATKNPRFLEEFMSGENILNIVRKAGDASYLDDFFSTIVECLNEFCKRVFFPRECSNWSLLKMRELFYKKHGRIKMDMADDVFYNILYSNMLEQKEFLNIAALKFNESSIFDFSGRKLWILPHFS